MPLGAMHQKVRTSNVSGFRRQHQDIYRHCQLGHVIPGHAILVTVCIFMLPMLEVAAEHEQLTTTHHSNLHGDHVTFCHSSLALPSFNNVLPAMTLQNKFVKYLSRSFSYSSVCRISFSPGLSVFPFLKKMVMVVILLLLLCGDIETNPGPVGEESWFLSV